jgi:hypothetical protein
MLPSQFKRLIEALRAQSGTIEEGFKRQERAIRDTSESSNEKRGEIPGIIISGIKTANKDVPTFEKAQRYKEYRQQSKILCAMWVTAGVTFLAFGAAAYYACIARKQLSALNQQIEHADRNFRIEQRAWIGFSFVPGNLTFTIHKPFLVPTLLINSGRTPAKDVSGRIVVGIIGRGQPIDFSYAPGHAHYEISAGTIFPNGQFQESFEGIEHGADHAQAILIEKPLLNAILSSEKLVVVHGRITYSDVFGQQHWTTYCRIVSNPSLIPPDCMSYNRTDDNQ